MFNSSVGESNSYNNLERYACWQAAMIDDWRSKWSQKTSGLTDPVFPFGVVQVRMLRSEY